MRPGAVVSRARRTYRTEGLIPLVRRAFRFVRYCLFEYRAYYLSGHSADETRQMNQVARQPKVDDFTFRIVSSNEEADELEAEGLEFRSYFPDFDARNALEKGASASCIFVGTDLASIGWSATTRAARDSLGEPPVRVDFSNNEACTGRAWTNPNYRHMGLHLYGNLKRRQFLVDKGIVMVRDAISKENFAAPKRNPNYSPNIYAEGRYLRVLWWSSWKERPLTQERRGGGRPLLGRARDVWRTEGLARLVRRALAWAVARGFKYATYYLYVNDGTGFRSMEPIGVPTLTGKLALKVVLTNAEADDLESQGFEFRRHAEHATRRLDAGAMAFCLFVGGQLGTIGWFCTTQRAKDSLNEPPVKVDFSGNEGWVGGFWTNPEYRGMGLHTYNSFKMIEYYLENKLAVRDRFMIATKNAPALAAEDKFGNVRYAEGRLVKILWWKWWKERPLEPSSKLDISQTTQVD